MTSSQIRSGVTRAQRRTARIAQCMARAVGVAMLALASLPLLASAGAPGPEPEDGLANARPAPPRSTSSPSAQAPAREVSIAPAPPQAPPTPRPTLDPAARLLEGDEASEFWTLFIELDSGHRIAQRFLLSNTGPGDHNAVAIGHLVEPGRTPYRYENGRRRPRWTLSDDRLFFDIAASHLDLHRPTGELRISKDDIQIQLFFEFPASTPAQRVPGDQLPRGYHVEVLAVGTPTRGSLQAPWMTEPIETTGRTWLAHTWTRDEESSLLDRRIDVYGFEDGTAFFGLQVAKENAFEGSWQFAATRGWANIESTVNVPASQNWTLEVDPQASRGAYPVPSAARFSGGDFSGQITFGPEWLRFDPLEVIPQPFRWFIRRSTQPLEVWAEAQIGVSIRPSLEPPSLPQSNEVASEIESPSNSKRETEVETAERSVTGVASITFLNPINRR